MAELAAGRVYKRKRVKDPTNENNYIDIPVIYQAQFKTMQEQAQESILYFNNSSTSSRKVHTHRVTNPNDPSSYVDVERIDEWYSKTLAEQAQESAFILKNTDPPPIQPDGTNNPSHEKTHIVRYYANNQAASQRAWIDVELIDQLRIVDAASQYQEWYWYMKHPELGTPVEDPNVIYPITQGYCDPALEAAPIETDLDPPYRLDPLRNIINCNWNNGEPATSESVWTLWLRNLYPWNLGWVWEWLQMGDDSTANPPYVVTSPNYKDCGVIGIIPFRDFAIGDFFPIAAPAWAKLKPIADQLGYEAALEGKQAIISVIISDEVDTATTA